MPTISKPKKVVNIGSSKYLHIGADYYRSIQQLTGEKHPKFRIIGDTALFVVPEGLPLKEGNLNSLIRQVMQQMVDNIGSIDNKQPVKEKQR